MSHYKSNVRDQVFNLFEVLGVDQTLGQGAFSDLDADTAQEMQNEQAEYAEAMDDKYMQMLRDYGWTVLVPTDEEWLNIQKAMFEDVWPELTPIIGSNLINGLYDALEMPRPE